MEIIQESYVFSKNDLYINYDKFESDKSNICLITGLSGSGKSTLAEQIASKNKAEWIELDLFEHCNGFTDDQLKEAGQVFYDYLSAHKDIWDKLKKKELHGKDLGDEINKFVHYCISWCKKNKSKKWVIEGVQIYSFMKFEEIRSYPLVIKNTSALKSIIQRWKRNGDGKIDLMKELRNEFPQLLAWYKDEEKALSDFRKSIIQESSNQKPYTIITDGITVTRSYGYTSPKNGIYNAIVDVNASIRARGRSELLVIKGDEVYLSKSKKGLCEDYSIPGGGWDPSEPHDKSAIREAEEEARLKTKNVKYADRYLSLYDEPHDWVKREIPEEFQWRGYYTEVYVGEYAGKYSGKIEDEDKDDIIKTGKFYKIKEVFDELHPIHQNAILNYLALSKNESNNPLQENGSYLNVQDCMLENASNDHSVLNEDALMFIATVAFAAEMSFVVADLTKDLRKDLKDKYAMEYYVSSRRDGKPNTPCYGKSEYALLHYAYKNGIRNGEKNTIFVDDSNRKALNNTIYIYGKNKVNTKLIKSGTLESLCKSHNIKIKEIDKSCYKERSDVFNKALSELKSSLPANIKSKGKFYSKSNSKDKELYDDFVNGISNDAFIFYASLWDIDKEARTHEHEGANNNTIWEPLVKCMNAVSKKLPNGYRICNSGDWDDIMLSVECSKSIKESTILETKRFELDSKDFGLPDKRKYPLTDAKHVKSAIKFFNYVDEEDEAELARNIKRKAKEFGVPIRCGKQNRLSKYINKEYVNEFMAAGAIGNCMYAVNNGNIKQHISQGDHIVSATDSYPFTKKEKKKKKDPVDGRISVYMGDGEKLSVNESSSKVPIYIIAYDYDSLFAGALKLATHSNYNHIAIALSPDLNDAYTFARSVKGDHSIKGFTKEPLSQMIKERGNFIIKVNAVYVPKSAYDKIESMIKDYKKHKNDTDYNYGNLIRGVLGIKIDNDDLDSDSMNCSIFVDYLLKSAGIDITGNPNSNLVFPSHLANADENNDNVITVYCGSAKGYDKKKIARMKFIGESGKVKTPKKCKKCGSSNIGVFIKGEPVFLCKDCGAYNGTVPFKEEVEPDDTFFDDIMKQFEDLDMEPIPTDIFNERKDQA